MRISFACGSCATVLEADAQATGQTVACPRCGTALKVPAVRPGPGVTIGGFRIKKLIARGGMGEVYLAEQLSLGRDVALKILPPHFKSDPETVQRFLAEVRTAAKLQHPNLVTVYEAGQDSGVYFLAMAYIDGQTLDERLEQKGAIPEAQALEITCELAGALSAAWEAHRLIHCDVKPGNVMLDRNSKPHLMDMGLSKLLTESATTATAAEAFGTPNYVSPEQSLNEPHLDFHSDMFSLGMTLYHMLTGRLPFDAPTPAETLHRLDTEMLSDPRTYNPNITPGCVVLLEIMLGRKAGARYPDWESLLKDIARVRKGGKPVHSPLSPDESVLARTAGAVGSAGGIGFRSAGRPKTSLKLRTGESVLSGEKPPPEKPKASHFLFWLLMLIVVIVINVVGVYHYHGGFRNWVRTLWDLSGGTPETEQPPATVTATNETGTVVPVPPPPPPSHGMSEREAELQKQFLAAQRYEKQNPDDLLIILSRYRGIQKDGAGTVWADKAAIEIRRLETIYQSALKRIRKRLQAEVDGLVAKGKPEEAIACLRNYKGSFQKETEAERTAQADKLQAQLDKERDMSEKIKPFLIGVADELSRMDFAALQRRLVAAGTDPVLSASADCQPIRKMALKVAAMPEAVLESFKRDIGKTVTIRTPKGDDKGEIVSVSGDTIQLKKTVVIDGQATGFVEEKYRVTDLTVDEWLRRLTENSTEQQLMRGLLTCQSKAVDKAREMFQQSGHPLGALLAASLGDLQAGAAQHEKTMAETAAHTAYDALLHLAGADLVKQDAKTVPGLIRRAKVGSEVRTKIQTALQSYWLQHGKTDWTKSHMDVLNALAEIGNKAPKTVHVDEDALDKALDKLKADNPGGSLNCRATLEGNGIVLSLRGSRKVTDLSALARLPIKQLNLAGCVRIADISLLASMPLESLNLDDTLVEDLSPLQGAPLKELSLNRCKNIRSLKPLKDCPLESLSVNGCADNLDLTPVLTLPGIKINK